MYQTHTFLPFHDTTLKTTTCYQYYLQVITLIVLHSNWRSLDYDVAIIYIQVHIHSRTNHLVRDNDSENETTRQT
jgi:hypothetical protein